MASIEDQKRSAEALVQRLRDLAKVYEENPDSFPPEKYSQAYFEEQIQQLRARIAKTLPNKESLVGTVFLPLIAGLKSAKTSLETSKNLKKKLEEAQKEHPDDKGYASLLDGLKESLDEAQTSIEKLEEATTNEGCDIAKNRRFQECLEHLQPEILTCTVFVQATPKKLAEWVAESPEKHGKLLDVFLESCDRRLGGPCLMECFLQQGGPSNGNYGPALVIYDQLLAEFTLEHFRKKYLYDDPDLVQRLALAVALELATPVQIFKSDKYVDPIERFKYYAKLAKTDELDESFYNLTIWELRKVVNANATHEDLTWGREFLKNYRPDEVSWKDEKWRYIEAVRTDVGYRHPDHEFTNYQELISAGGECGPRAFFGRFIAKAWGIPTWGCRQPGHAAMTHYTTSGWVVCLGADWPYSWWDDDRYCGGETKTRHGPDFFEETKARNAPRDEYYKRVVLMECLAESLGETVEEEFVEKKFCRSLALAQRKYLALKYGKKAATTCETSSNNQISVEQPLEKQEEHSDAFVIPAASFCNVFDTFVIPAASFCDKPTKNTMILDCFTGGKQIHLKGHGSVEYQLPATLEAGTYELSAKVVSVHQSQMPLVVQVTDSKWNEYELIYSSQNLEVPYTKGYWQDTESIRVALGGSGEKLIVHFIDSLSSWGLSIKEFVLKPVETTSK